MNIALGRRCALWADARTQCKLNELRTAVHVPVSLDPEILFSPQATLK